MRRLSLVLLVSMFVQLSLAASYAGKSYSLPQKVTGVSHPIVSINGTWDFKFDDKSQWTPVKVPGELAMQGFAIKHDQWFYYKKIINVPADFRGKRVILRFDGVYSHARLSVNGVFIREHFGGFTRWDSDITSLVRPGQPNTISLAVEDRIDDISYASGYAHHPIGGILRDVTLFALPENTIYDVNIETHLDSIFKDAVLRYSFEYEGKAPAKLTINLKDMNGRNVKLAKSAFAVRQGHNEINIPVANPAKWDAEHPNLYQLTTTLRSAGKSSVVFNDEVGFRDIKIVKNKLLVNGRQVKLRGACRHDVDPYMGRGTTPYTDSLDVVLFKESNMNFVRTSHYPPNERFLKFCDRYGIYVESETACCFVNTYRQKNYAPGATHDNPDFEAKYMGQLQEEVKVNRLHPSVLIWSIGNESTYGSNFQKSYDWIKKVDPTRPVIFSYPGTAKDKGVKVYDILSMHYPGWDGAISQWGYSCHNFEYGDMPVIFDEWAHPACYTYSTLQNDPGIREFWGKSIDLMWDGVYNASGALGGAIWCYQDDIFELPKPKVGNAYWKEFAHTAKPEGYQGECVGYGEWGIVDLWRRKKPEFWSVKKGYSPVRLLAGKIINANAGTIIQITIQNRFDHTNLSEISARYTHNGQAKTLTLPSLEPHQKGILTIPANDWQDGNHLVIDFVDAKGQLIDRYDKVIGHEQIDYPELGRGTVLRIEETSDSMIISGDGFTIPFDRKTGLMCNVKAGNEVVIDKGPFMNMYVNLNHLSGAEVRKMANYYSTEDRDWTLESMVCNKLSGGNVNIEVKGHAKGVKCQYQMLITPSGKMTISYAVDGLPNGYLRETGLKFYLSEDVKHLSWQRDGYWDCYPDSAFAGNKGDCSLYQSRQVGYGERPVQEWQDDTHNYYYWADRGANCNHPLTQKAKGMKENIYYYTVSTDARHQLSVVSTDAKLACRMNKMPDEQLVIYINNRWDYPEIAWGNYCKTIEALPCYGVIEMRIK